MNKPTLSICLITYNQASYIKEAIDTILDQKVNFTWELIIADDCSTDGTREIVLDYKKKFPGNIKLILQKDNLGPEKNWLDLMAYPKSKYVLYADGDDYFTDSTKLQRQVDFLEANKDFSICFHPVKVIYEDGSRPDEVFPTSQQRLNKDVLELKDLLVNNFIQTGSAMYRWRFTKENIKDFVPDGIAPGDWFLHILNAHVGKIGFINRVMSVYRKHPGGLWWDADNNKKEFWAKNGVAWLRFYIELLKIYGSNQELRDSLEGSTINLMNSLKKIDKKHNIGLFNRAVSALPEAAEIYIKNLRQQVTNLHSHADEQAKIIKHYVDLSEHLKGISQQLEAENKRLNGKLVIRLPRALKRNIKSGRGNQE